jgi:hypothetical protein
MSVIANSTASNAVFRSDGIQLYGLDAELELKVHFHLALHDQYMITNTINTHNKDIHLKIIDASKKR